jgi:hypothetical protein
VGVGEAVAVTARDEIRAAGLVCPSCRENLADLIGTGHRLEFGETIRCQRGTERVPDEMTFDEFRAAANIDLLESHL